MCVCIYIYIYFLSELSFGLAYPSCHIARGTPLWTMIVNMLPSGFYAMFVLLVYLRFSCPLGVPLTHETMLGSNPSRF